MIWSSGTQKQQYLQWFWSLACKSNSIYIDSEAWHTKATVFTMILSPGIQKQLYLWWFETLACKNNNIYNDFAHWYVKTANDFKPWHVKTIVFTMILSYGMQKQQYLQWFWVLNSQRQRPILSEHSLTSDLLVIHLWSTCERLLLGKLLFL